LTDYAGKAYQVQTLWLATQARKSWTKTVLYHWPLTVNIYIYSRNLMAFYCNFVWRHDIQHNSTQHNAIMSFCGMSFYIMPGWHFYSVVLNNCQPNLTLILFEA
jgi:hypothetical protein